MADDTPVGGIIQNPSYPPTLQPGGPGNPVTFPTMEPEALTGKWMAACGHAFNTFEIRKVWDASHQVHIAQVCCPVCGFLERTIVPYDSIHDDVTMALFS